MLFLAGFVIATIMWVTWIAHYYTRNGGQDKSKYCYCRLCDAFLSFSKAFQQEKDID